MLSLVLAISLALGVNTAGPRAAQADPGDAVAAGIIGLAVICAVNPRACSGNGRRAAPAGPRDAIALDRTQAMWVQGGLQNVGFYYDVIDGAIGAGTRASIRQYQSAIGENATGALTGKQINDLVALSPDFLPYGADPVYMFNADIAGDLVGDEVRQLQAALNSRGFNAGVVDGAFGGMTRNAIASYKAVEGLPGGPLPTRRLLAHLNGWPAPEPAGLAFAQQMPAGYGDAAMPASAAAPAAMAPAQPGVATTTPVAVPQLGGTAAAPAAPAARDLTFDLVRVALGMDEGEVALALDTALGGNRLIETAPGSMFGGNDVLSSGTLSVQETWPQVPGEQFATFRDSARPDLGVLAAVRLIKLPDGVDQAGFEAQVLPGLIDKYGTEGRVGDELLWIGAGAARTAAAADPAAAAACGDIRIATFEHDAPARQSFWSTGRGVILDTVSLDSVSADCGQVMRVSYEAPIIRIVLWNSTVLAQQVVVPAIRF